MQVKSVKVGNLDTNCYVVSYDKKAIIIDPGDDFYKIKNLVGSDQVIGVFVTHNHFDHVGALKQVLNYYGVSLYNYHNLEERRYDVKGLNIEVIYTPGHSSDSITLYLYDYEIMFVGDFIFKRSIGRTDLETGSSNDMKHSLEKIKHYKSRIILYPGHGDYTILGDEIRLNPYFKNISV